MNSGPRDVAQIRLANALILFDEFIHATVKHADAATLRGLEGRFAERLQIRPSYWSQIKGRSRQIGERLARQFEHLCHRPAGWMDQPHPAGATAPGLTAPSARSDVSRAGDESAPRDDDERFIVGLVLTYYRRHPQRAKARLLDLLGEVLTPPALIASSPPSAPAAQSPAPASAGKSATLHPSAEEAQALWLRTQAGVAPLKRKK